MLKKLSSYLTPAGLILDLCWVQLLHPSSALSFQKNIFIRNGWKWHLFKGCKQTNCHFFKKCALKKCPMPPMSRIGPDLCWAKYVTLSLSLLYKLQASVTSKIIFGLSLTRNDTQKHHIFTSFPHCYGPVMKPNVNPVTLISKKNIARVANFLFKVKLQALFAACSYGRKRLSLHIFFWELSE